MNDVFCRDIRMMLEKDILPDDVTRRTRCLKREHDFCIKEDGVLYQLWQPIIGNKYVKYRALIPDSLQDTYIRCAHFSENMSHLGIDRLISFLRERVIFKGMYEKVALFVSKCETCRQVKPHNKRMTRPPGLYEITTEPWQIAHSDVAGPLPISASGARYIVLVTDRTTGYIIAWAARDLSAESLARKFHARVSCIFGSPKCLVTDNATYYRSKLWTATAAELGIKLRFAAPYSPQSNGSAEASVKKVMNTLKCMARDHPHAWDSLLPTCVYALNNSLHTTHKMTPHSILFGRLGRTPLDNTLRQDEDKPLFQVIRDLEEYRDAALQTVAKYQQERQAAGNAQSHKQHNKDYLVEGTICYWRKPELNAEKGKFGNANRGPYIITKRYPYTAIIKHMHSNKTHKLPINVGQLFTCGKGQAEASTKGPLFQA